MPNPYGFVEQTVAGGVGVVIAGNKNKPQEIPDKPPQQPQQQPVESISFVIPYTEKQKRIQYLENVRDFMNNEIARIEEALRQERGY